MAAEKKPIPMVVIVAPLLIVLGLAGFVGLNLYRDYQRTERDEEEQQRRDEAEQHERVKKPKPVAVVDTPLDAGAPAPVEDDLTNLPKGGQKKTGTPTKAATGTPAQRAFNGFKSAYDKLEAANETAAKKYRVQRLRLEDQLGGGTPPNEAKFVADCEALKQQILEALRNPQNQ
jgi:hypothetical protein